MGFKHASKNFVHSIPAPVFAVWACIIAIAAIGLAASIAEAAPAAETQRCFPAKRWGPAPDSVRPCASLIGNSPEAGAVRFVVADASGVVRYSGFVNTPFNRVAHVKIVALYEDGSLRYLATNFNGKRTEGGIGNLTD